VGMVGDGDGMGNHKSQNTNHKMKAVRFLVMVLFWPAVIGSLLVGCAAPGDAGTRTTTVAPDGTQTIVERIDPDAEFNKLCERLITPGGGL
jgi:hypothetical protein